MCFMRGMSAHWKPLVICPEPELARRIGSVLAGLGCESLAHTEYPRMGSIAGLIQDTGCNICFLDVATNSDPARARIAELAPLAPVIALHHRNDADLILRCLRRGALRRSHRRPPASTRDPA